MTLIGKASEHGLHDIAQRVLAPHFHQGGSSEKKVRTAFPVMQINTSLFHGSFETRDKIAHSGLVRNSP